MGKSLLVVTSLPSTDKRYKRFVKLLKRRNDVCELWPGTWFVKSEKKPHLLTERLASLFEDDKHTPDEQLVITTIGPDCEHMNGWLNSNDEIKPWNWIREK